MCFWPGLRRRRGHGALSPGLPSSLQSLRSLRSSVQTGRPHDPLRTRSAWWCCGYFVGGLSVHVFDLLQAVAGSCGDDLRQDVYAGPDQLDPRRAGAEPAAADAVLGVSAGDLRGPRVRIGALSGAVSRVQLPDQRVGVEHDHRAAARERHGRGRCRSTLAARRRCRWPGQRDQAGYVVGPVGDGAGARWCECAELCVGVGAAVRARGQVAGPAVPVGARVRRRSGAVVRVVPDAVGGAGCRVRLFVRALDPEQRDRHLVGELLPDGAGQGPERRTDHAPARAPAGADPDHHDLRDGLRRPARRRADHRNRVRTERDRRDGRGLDRQERPAGDHGGHPAGRLLRCHRQRRGGSPLHGPGPQSASDLVMSDQLLVVEDLTVTLPTGRGPVEVVKNVSFTVGRDDTLGIVGESGSGKSMTALAVLGLLPRGARTSGSVRLDGTELLGRSERDLRSVRGNAISMVFQDPLSSLNPYYTVGLQIAEMYRTHRGGSRRAARQVAIEALERGRIPDPGRRVDHYPHQFSGGQRQRVMIAMALCCSPSLLIADEPTTALDVTVQAQILELLADLQSTTGTGMLFITHDLAVISSIARRVLVMRSGDPVEYGSAEQVFSNPRHEYTRMLLDAVPRIDDEVAS